MPDDLEVGTGVVPTSVLVAPTYFRLESGAPVLGVTLQVEDGVLWFLPVEGARAVAGRFLAAIMVAESFTPPA